MKREEVLLGYIYGDNGLHNGAMRLKKSLKNIAAFIVQNQQDKVITDIADNLVVKTIGSFIDICPDKEFLSELMEELVPLQMSGEIPEVQYCNLERSNKTVNLN